MNRAMFSGVAGLKTHQTKMDVIGNNISNVNTYGFKSQRAVFSDIFYQTLRSASAGTASRGGTNPSTVGYGSQLLAVQSQMTQSSMQSTGFGLDVAITGEGYLQVMDADGNIFYTKAGMLDYDSNGYLTDVNGNFVLGSTTVNGEPSTQRIKLDALGAVEAAQATASQSINGTTFTITAQNATTAGNVSFSFTSSSALPIGQKAQATISNSAITITLNASEEFASLADLQTAINDAITEANGGAQHEAGEFTITTDPADAFITPLTGEEIVGINFGVKKGSITMPGDGRFFGGFSIAEVGNDFAGDENSLPVFHIERTLDGTGVGGEDDVFTITATVGGVTYTGTVTADQMDASGKLVRNNGARTTDTITINYPSYSQVIQYMATQGGATFNALAGTGGTNGVLSDVGGISGFNVTSTTDPVTDLSGQTVTVAYDQAANEFTFTVGGETVTVTAAQAGRTVMTDQGNYSIRVPSFTDLLSKATTIPSPADVTATGATPSEPSQDLGLSSLGFLLEGGTEGGAITLDELTSISIGQDGTISVYHPDKGLQTPGKISLAVFANPQGLQQEGTNYFSATVNSGEAVLCDPGTNGSGNIQASTLEMSNVDLSEEFANMITTQRGFQANSRIITVSDTMLEELINLKR